MGNSKIDKKDIAVDKTVLKKKGENLIFKKSILEEKKEKGIVKTKSAVNTIYSSSPASIFNTTMGWTVKMFCEDINNKNICKEVEKKLESSSYPIHLRIPRNVDDDDDDDLDDYSLFAPYEYYAADKSEEDEHLPFFIQTVRHYEWPRQTKNYEITSSSVSPHKFKKRADPDHHHLMHPDSHDHPSEEAQDAEVKQSLRSSYDSFQSMCGLPSRMRTNEILCKIYPSSVICISYCVFGYTFPDGIKRTSSCSSSDNRWSKPFEECEPFVDCTLELQTPGRLSCVTNKLKVGTKCDIECESYEDRENTPVQTYECLIDGRWMPKEPFCAVPEGISLVDAPIRKVHKNIIYPK
ncbi:uncharacterized protein LOC118199111 isoform X2 [Stegodyphus dumicola]|nr:uncharacterized protein LOC118199111 isoform X2 [Stegodyphus dumicola]